MFHLERRRQAGRLLPTKLVRWTSLFAASLLLAGQATADNLFQSYCSPQNTGNDLVPSHSIWQSNGLCKTTCTEGGYALAIVQGANCWCSNEVPGKQVSVGSCSAKCIGYPYEYCGNEDSGLYGYILLGTPTATAGSSPSNTGSSSSSSTSSSDSSPSSSSASPTRTLPRVTQVQIITISNAPTTRTVTSMPTIAQVEGAGSGNSSSSTERVQTKNGISGGVIAGAVIAAVVGSLLIAGILFLLWRRRHRRQELENGTAAGAAGAVTSGNSSSRPTRNTSVLSKQGLLAQVYPSAATTRSNPTIVTTAPEMSGGAVSPISERRRSQPLFYDQRLNPTTLMDFDNGSRVSVNTLPDNRDFSRPLNVTNPDHTRDWD